MEKIIDALTYLLSFGNSTVKSPSENEMGTVVGWRKDNQGKYIPIYKGSDYDFIEWGDSNPSPVPMPTGQPIQKSIQEPLQTIDDYAYYTRGQVPQELQPVISASARKYGLDPSILAAILFQESGINPNVGDNISTSESGVVSRDRGIAQINSVAHPEISDEQAKDINFAIPFLAKELSDVYKQRNSWPQSIAAYNVGRGRVGYDDSRDEYGLGEKGRAYVSGIRKNLDPKYAEKIGLPNYGDI